MYHFDEYVRSIAAFGDITGDGIEEVIAVTGNSTVSCLEGFVDLPMCAEDWHLYR